MLYHTYNTEAFVLNSFPVGESSRYVYLFTRDLGLVGAHAQGARKISSKLRYALDDLSHAKVSLVRGKNTWRLTNAAPEKHFFNHFRHDREKLIAVSNILFTVRKLIAGEDSNVRLYNILCYGLEFLRQNELLTREIRNAEAILMLRILDALGYFGHHESLGGFVGNDPLTQELVAKMDSSRKTAIDAINSSLRETHL